MSENDDDHFRSHVAIDFSEFEVLSVLDVSKVTTLSESAILRLEKSGDFPKSIQLSESRVGWVRQEVNEWIREKMDARSA